jgi:hypothetical protein
MTTETTEGLPSEVRNGHAVTEGYLTADQMEANAPADIVEQDVEGVFGGRVRIRSLTAHQAAKVQQASFKLGGRGGQDVQVSVTNLEVAKFLEGVVIPEGLDHNRVMRLYQNSGPSFQKVLNAIDEASGTGEQADKVRGEAKAAFPGPDAA